MRVAFIDQSGSAAGGAEESLALLLDHLPDDIDPLVITFDEGPFADRLRARGYAVATVALAGAISRSTRERPQLLGLASIPSAAFALAGLLRRERIDVVHTNTVKAHFVGGVAARLARLPCISHLRDLLEGRSLVALRAVCALCSQERIAISGAVAKWYALRSTHVIDEPLDAGALAGTVDRAEARRALGLPLDGPIVAMVGRINRWKGQDRFIRAAALTRDRVRAHFAIVGSAIFRDADFVAELEAEVDRHGLRDAFTFVPWVTEVASAYAAIDLHANCSSREPFGRTTIEAAAFGVPTVCFSDGGAAEAIVDGETGQAVAPGDERALADAIVGFIGDQARLLRAGAAARNSLGRFDARRHAERVAGVLRAVA